MTPRTCIPCEKIEEDCYDWYARHADKLREVRTKQADIVFIGDSITHFWCDENNPNCFGVKTWEKYFGKRRTLNLGYGFDRTQNMLWRVRNGELDHQNPKVFVINAGTNQFSFTPRYSGDSPEDAAEGVKTLISELYNRFPEAKFLVMAVFPRLGEHDGVTVQSMIDGLNRLVEAFVRTLGRAKFIDISGRFRTPDGRFDPSFFADGRCHPNEKGYEVWAQAIEPDLRRILREEA